MTEILTNLSVNFKTKMQKNLSKLLTDFFRCSNRQFLEAPQNE